MDTITGDAQAIQEAEVFDTFRSMLKYVLASPPCAPSHLSTGTPTTSKAPLSTSSSTPSHPVRCALSARQISLFTDPRSTGFLNEIEATARDNDPTDHAAYRSHKQALEMYAFLLQWFVTAAERGAVSKAAAETTLGANGKKVRWVSCDYERVKS